MPGQAGEGRAGLPAWPLPTSHPRLACSARAGRSRHGRRPPARLQLPCCPQPAPQAATHWSAALLLSATHPSGRMCPAASCPPPWPAPPRRWRSPAGAGQERKEEKKESVMRSSCAQPTAAGWCAPAARQASCSNLPAACLAAGVVVPDQHSSRLGCSAKPHTSTLNNHHPRPSTTTHRGLVVDGGCEVLLLVQRDGRVALDHPGGDATLCGRCQWG